MGRLWTEVARCEYEEPDRLVPEQFIAWVNNDDMTGEILQVTTLENIGEFTMELMLSWVYRVGVQRVQINILNNNKEARDFGAM